MVRYDNIQELGSNKWLWLRMVLYGHIQEEGCNQ